MSDDQNILQIDKLQKSIRVDRTTGLGSVHDVIKIICCCGVRNCNVNYIRLGNQLHTKIDVEFSS